MLARARLLATLVVTAMVVTAPISMPVAAADPGGRPAGSGDGVVTTTTRSTAPDGHEKAAAANNIDERSATKDRGEGKPVVPQQLALTRVDAAEPAGEGGGLAGTTAPPARKGVRGPVLYKRPVAGTASTVRFTDASTVNAAALSPFLRDIVSSAKRIRTVGVDAKALNSSLTAAEVTLALFPDVTVALQTTIAPSQGAGVANRSSTTYSGSGADGTAVVTIIGEEVHAAIWKGTKRYGIKPLGGGGHVVFEDGRMYPGEDEDPHELKRINVPGAKVAPGSPSGPARQGGAGVLAAVPVIDVMVAFDDAAEAAYGSAAAAEADIIEMINISNMSYANSLNDQQFALTNIVNLPYTPNAGDGTIDDSDYLAAVRSKIDGIVDSLHTSRDANSADLVAVISNMSSACGIAYLPASADPAELDAYSLTDYSCAVGNLSFPHELGHNMCAHHDPVNAGANPCQPDGFGHFGVAEDLRTVMSYGNVANGCDGCTRIPYFSNPDVDYTGWTTGVLGSRDNSRVLETTDLDVSNYRAPITSPAVAGVDGASCIFNTIEDAISMAPAGSTIYIAPGTYPAVTANLDYNISKNLDLVKGTADCAPTVGGLSTDVVLQLNAGSTVDAVVEVSGSAVVRFDRITIEGGNSAEGTLSVTGSANVTLDDSIVRNGNNPSATVGGGGVRVIGAAAQLTATNDAQIENNTATLGGGVYVDDGTVTISSLTNVELNTASFGGGGVYATNNATVMLSSNADILSNSAATRGGGVHLIFTSTLTVTGAATYVGFPGQVNPPARRRCLHRRRLDSDGQLGRHGQRQQRRLRCRHLRIRGRYDRCGSTTAASSPPTPRPATAAVCWSRRARWRTSTPAPRSAATVPWASGAASPSSARPRSTRTATTSKRSRSRTTPRVPSAAESTPVVHPHWTLCTSSTTPPPPKAAGFTYPAAARSP